MPALAKLPILVALCALPAAAAALPASNEGHGNSRGGRERPFERVADDGPLGVATIAFDDSAYHLLARRHASDAAFVLDGMPLPGGLDARLELRPVDAFAPGARAQVVGRDGEITLLAPRARCFAGHVEGGGTVFLGVAPGELHGYVTLGDEVYFVSTGEKKRRGRATVAHSSRTGGAGAAECGVASAEPFRAAVPTPSALAATAPLLRTADVFFEVDDKFRAKYASAQECVDYVAVLLAAASEVYRRDVGVRIAVPDRYLRVWESVPPWGVITGFNSLKNVYTYWLSSSNPLKNLPRAAVQVLTAPVFGGTARGTGGLCDNVRAYEIASLNGRFPYPTQHLSRDNWDLFVVCHELGHTFGSVHSADYSPPIACADGSGPDSGTVMSYCHTQYGIARVGMRFHLREQSKIRASLGGASCLAKTALVPGDYDGDGAPDAGDLVALRSVIRQGFRSLGAEEALDMDGDLDVDAADEDALAEIVYGSPPASVVVRNGRNVNPRCLESLGAPLLGKTWRARVLAAGAGSSTVLVGYDEPLDGVMTPRGELLVRTAPYQGTKLFSSTAASDGTAAVHEVALPLDSALFGLEVSFQGLVLTGPSGDQYCNALDVVLSPYE